MALHQDCKSRRVTAADVVLQQLPIGPTGAIAQQHRPAKVLDDPVHLAGRHALSFVGDMSPSHLLLPADGGLIHSFWERTRSCSMSSIDRSRRDGMTLIELLVVIGIIALLIGL